MILSTQQRKEVQHRRQSEMYLNPVLTILNYDENFDNVRRAAFRHKFFELMLGEFYGEKCRDLEPTTNYILDRV
jgi:hypothetical protein